ncbi:MAG: hypothetical protein Q8L87_00115, partial [Anaerolineales bacterium]|nr:hypothetical protein [Anaerolineales bacterium]
NGFLPENTGKLRPQSNRFAPTEPIYYFLAPGGDNSVLFCLKLGQAFARFFYFWLFRSGTM